MTAALIDTSPSIDTRLLEASRDDEVRELKEQNKALRREIEVLKRRGSIKVVPGYRGA